MGAETVAERTALDRWLEDGEGELQEVVEAASTEELLTVAMLLPTLGATGAVGVDRVRLAVSAVAGVLARRIDEARLWVQQEQTRRDERNERR